VVQVAQESGRDLEEHLAHGASTSSVKNRNCRFSGERNGGKRERHQGNHPVLERPRRRRHDPPVLGHSEAGVARIGVVPRDGPRFSVQEALLERAGRSPGAVPREKVSVEESSVKVAERCRV
jgi:hypothetical protein